MNTVKLATSPATMRSGLRPDAPAARRIGSTGSTHGDTAVTTPARKPMASRISIRYRPSLPVIRYDAGIGFGRVPLRHVRGSDAGRVLSSRDRRSETALVWARLRWGQTPDVAR